MTITISAGEIKSGIQAAIDLLAAARDGFKDIAADEAVLIDAEGLAAPLVGAGLGIVLGPLVGPVLVEALALAIEYNRNAMPGGLSREGSGEKGSNPWRS